MHETVSSCPVTVIKESSMLPPPDEPPMLEDWSDPSAEDVAELFPIEDFPDP